jgi:chromate reductase
MKLLGISGSLRAESSNSRLLSVAAACMPAGVTFEIADCLAELPHFNPDLDPAENSVVSAWVSQVKTADGLIISTPEYARGYPGSLKNAFDWLVQSDAHIDKPFMMLHASARSSVARDSLITVIETMSGLHVTDASITINLLGKSLSADEIRAAHGIEMTGSLAAFVAAINAFKQPDA